MNNHHSVMQQQRRQRSLKNQQLSQSSDVTASYQEAVSADNSSTTMPFQASHVQFKSLGSIEEESPRWTHPPEPQSQQLRQRMMSGSDGTRSQQQIQMYQASSVSGGNETHQDQNYLLLFGDRTSDGDGQSSNSQNQLKARTMVMHKTTTAEQRDQHRKSTSHERHVRSQPALLQAMDSGRAQDQQTQQINIEQHYRGESDQQVLQPYTQRIQLAGLGSMGDYSNRQGVGFSSPAYHNPDSQMQIFSGRTGRNPNSQDAKALIFNNFVDKLYVREKVSEIADELRSLESIFLPQVAKETPELYRQIIGEHQESGKQKGSSGKTHMAVIEATLLQAQSLREQFSKFQIRRNEVHSFNQLVEGINLDTDQNQTGTLNGTGIRLHSVESLPDKVHGQNNFLRMNEESTINHIKMGSMPSERQKENGSNQEDSNDNFMVQIMRQQEQEIAKCNKLVDKLKSESADLELTIVDQRSEIQNLCNKLKQSHLRNQAEEPIANKANFERREMENLVNRLKEEIRMGHDGSQASKQQVKEMRDVIGNLQGQINSLKHKLVMSEDATKSLHTHEFQDSLKEIADLRTQNCMINDKYQEMVQNVHEKESEILDMEEKSRLMLIEAQKDAHECIKYFKNLAFQSAAQERGGQPAASRSQSPIEKRQQMLQQKASPLMNQLNQEASRATQSSFPKSLGPIAQSKRNNAKSIAFQQNKQEFNLNGVRLRMNTRPGSTIECSKKSNSKDQNRQSLTRGGQRAQTLSPMPGKGPRGASYDRAADNSSISAKTKSQNQSLKFARSRGNIDHEGDQEVDVAFASKKLFEVEAKLECTINTLVNTFTEISETKQGISSLVSNYGEQYCFQLQKFSVLAYDYLERIDNLHKRESQIGEELGKQALSVDKLKQMTVQQNEHIAAQNSLILQQKNQIALQTVAHDRVSTRQDEEVGALGELIQAEFPLLRDTIMASHVALLQTKKINQNDTQALSNVRNHHDLGKKKVKILEEELEKSLQTSQLLEETIQANRKKFNQLVDLIKDIWQEEVQNHTSGNPMSTTLSQNDITTTTIFPQPMTTPFNIGGYGNQGSTTATGRGATVRLQPIIDTVSDMNQTIYSTQTNAIGNNQMNNTTTDVPMPISWLSDISEHIKTLKEMNDFQTDEVFQIVNMLHCSEQQKKPTSSANEGMLWTRNADSNSTEEDELKASCQESGISQTYQAPGEFADGQTLRDDDQVIHQQQMVEESDTERGLEHYDQQARRVMGQDYQDDRSNRDIGEADNLYIHTTSVSKSKSKTQTDYQFNSQSEQLEDKKEMSFSQRLDDETLDNIQQRGLGGGFVRQQMRDAPPMPQQRPSQSSQVSNNKRAFSHSHKGGRQWIMSSKTSTAPDYAAQNQQAAPKRDRSHPSRNYEWPDGNLFHDASRIVETQRVGLDQQRRSLNVTSNRWKEVLFSDGNHKQNNKMHQNQLQHNSSFAAMYPLNGGQQMNHLMTSLPGKNYRASIDMTATVAGTMAVDSGNKRNELYSMLREEVLGHLKQKEVSKDTIMGMKAQMKVGRKELNAANRAYQILFDEKESQVETSKLLENEIKDQELQIDEMQGVVQDREAQMENLKMQIEDFEKELLGLQDQMTHVMKLNQEIGMASEHWERSYHQLQQESEREKAHKMEEFQRQAQKKMDKIQQFKHKLQEKEKVLKGLQQELVTATTYRDEIESRKFAMVSVSMMTDPAMELLEKHKFALESKLGQVKQDVSAVLDQVEKEQIEKGQIGERLYVQKETNKTLVTELYDSKKVVIDVRNEIQTLQLKLQTSLNEVQQMNEVMEQDQEHFQEQIGEAEKINSELQQQVEQVTRAAQELQEQMAGHQQTNDGLEHNAEIQEQKINQIEDQLLYYQKQLKQKNRAIAGLEQKIIQNKRQSKRETRSVSIPRITKRSSTANAEPVIGASFHQNNYSQMQENNHINRNNSCSSAAESQESSFIIGGGDTQIDHDKRNGRAYLGQEDMINSLHTSQQSIFDEAPTILPDDSATFNRPQPEDFATDNNRQHQAMLRPPRKSNKKVSSRKNARGKNKATPNTPGAATQNTSICHQRGDTKQQHVTTNRNSFVHHDTSVGLDNSAMMAPLSKTQVGGISTIMGVSQLTGCCCGTTNCINNSNVNIGQNQQMTRKQSDFQDSRSRGRQQTSSSGANGTGKMTAIDDLQSSYKHFKVKQVAKKKVKRTLKMTETLIRYYLNEAQLKAELKKENTMQSKGKRQNTNSDYSTLNDLRKHVSDWSAQFSLDNKIVTEEEGLEAKSYFKKRNPMVINCLRAFVEQVNLRPETESGTNNTNSEHPHEQIIKSNNKEPPQIVSHRNKVQMQNQDQTDTEYSELNDCNTSRRFSEAQRNYGTLQKDLNQNTAHLVLNQEDSIRNVNSFRSPVNGLKAISQRNGQTTLGLVSLKSPTSSCRNCTATFHQTQSVANDMISHCKTLFQKFLQTGRSLAGICYGGCIFMGDSLKQNQRQKVDYALSFLAKDSSEFEGTNGQSMEELWGVVDGLLTCLSQIISGSCQKSLQANAVMDQKQQQLAFESIAQKSIEMSMDQNHMISRMERASFDCNESAKKSIDFPMPPPNSAAMVHGQSIGSQQVNSRLQELEQRIKQKFSNIKSLETLLDTILGKQKDTQALIPQLANDINGLQKVFLNIRRVVSKLKIELHQDYLHLSQILLHFQTSKDNNASMTTTFEMPVVTQTQHTQLSNNGQQTLQPVSQDHIYLRGACDSNTLSTYFNPSNLANNNGPVNSNRLQMQIGSGVLHSLQPNVGPVTTREPTSTSSGGGHQQNAQSVSNQQLQQQQQTRMHTNSLQQRGYSISSHQQPMLSNLNLAPQVQYSVGKQSSSNCTTSMPGSLPSAMGQGAHSARFSANSMGTSTARNDPRSIDKIVEDLQGLTFEYSNATVTQQNAGNNSQHHNASIMTNSNNI